MNPAYRPLRSSEPVATAAGKSVPRPAHHRPCFDPLAAISELYGRDDVAGPLQAQKQIISAVLAGFRPLRPIFRGARPSVPDVEISLLPALDDEATEIPAVAVRPEPSVEPDSSSDSEPEAAKDVPPPLLPSTNTVGAAWDEVATTQSGGNSPTLCPIPCDTLPLPDEAGFELGVGSPQGSLEALDFQEVAASGVPETVPAQSVFAPGCIDSDVDEFGFLLNPVTKVVHVAKTCSATHPACQYKPLHGSATEKPLRAGCGVRGCLREGVLLRSQEIPKGFRMCLKHGCGQDPRFRAVTHGL